MSKYNVELSKATLATILLLGNVVLGTLSAKADTNVTLYFYSDSPVNFDLQKVANKSASTLAEADIGIISIEKVNKQDLPILLSNFKIGESAKLGIKIAPGTTIEGSPLSSYPATITVDVIGIHSTTAITSLRKSARSQHTNPASGLTNAIRIALGPVLKELSSELRDLEPWPQTPEPVIANTSVVAPSNTVISNSAASKSNIAPPSSLTSSNQVSLPLTPNSPTQIVQIPAPDSVLVPGRTPRLSAGTSVCADKSVSPFTLKVIPEALKSGSRVRILSCYSIFSNQYATATITTTIGSPNGEKFSIKEDSIERAFGYWMAEFNMKVPESFTPGIYTLTQKISHLGRTEVLEEKLVIE